MKKISYYILAWHDEGDTNRSKVLWKGTDPIEAKQHFDAIKPTNYMFFVELWETGSYYDEDVRLEYKTL